jgi:hypothetical protein
MNQEWQKRRMGYTKENLFFALVGDDLIRDQIPLHEISKIEVMREHHDLEMLLSRYGKGQSGRQSMLESRRPSTSSVAKKSDHEDDSPTLTSLRVLQIGTIEKGYNSGRTYYLQTDPPEESMELESHMKHYVEAARKRVNGHSRFKEMQGTALKIHDSAPFQALSAVFIIAVRFLMTPTQETGPLKPLIRAECDDPDSLPARRTLPSASARRKSAPTTRTTTGSPT